MLYDKMMYIKAAYDCMKFFLVLAHLGCPGQRAIKQVVVVLLVAAIIVVNSCKLTGVC